MNSDVDDRGAAPFAAVDAQRQLAQQVRRVALHQETAALLQQRARGSRSHSEAELLERRAAQHADLAVKLRTEIAAARRAQPKPG